MIDFPLQFLMFGTVFLMIIYWIILFILVPKLQQLYKDGKIASDFPNVTDVWGSHKIPFLLFAIEAPATGGGIRGLVYFTRALFIVILTLMAFYLFLIYR